MILHTLQRAPEAITSRELALALMERKGYDTQDAATVRLVEKRVDTTVRRREGCWRGWSAGRAAGGRLGRLLGDVGDHPARKLRPYLIAQQPGRQLHQDTGLRYAANGALGQIG